MSRVTLRLTLDVTYEIDDDTDLVDLRNALMDLGHHAAPRDLLTGDTDAGVVMFVPSVEEIQ